MTTVVEYWKILGSAKICKIDKCSRNLLVLSDLSIDGENWQP